MYSFDTHVCPNHPSDPRNVVLPCMMMHHLVLQTSKLHTSLRGGRQRMMHQRRNTPCIASALPWIQSSCWARAMWRHSSKTNTCNQTAASVEALASNQLSRVPGKLTRRLTTAEASVHKSAFRRLIILQYTMKYLVLVSYLFTEHQKLLAAEKPC